MLKKILSVFSVSIIMISSAVVTACNISQGYNADLKSLIQNDVLASSYAARTAILSKNDDIDPTYSAGYYSDQSLNNLFPKTAKGNTSKLSDLYQLIFNSTDVKSITSPGATTAQLNFNGTKKPKSASLSSTFNQIRELIPVITDFSEQSAGSLESVLQTSALKSLVKTTLPSALPYINSDLLDNLSGAFGKINPKNSSDPKAPKTWTYNDLMASATLRLSNFLNSLMVAKDQKAHAKYFPTADFYDVTNLKKNLITATINGSSESYIGNALQYLLTDGSNSQYLYTEPPANDKPKNFQVGLPNILGFIVDLGTFISAFPLDYQTTDKSHLFGANITNFAEKEKVLASSVPDQQSLEFNIQKIINEINSWFNDPQDPDGYNLLKIFNILFDNQAAFNVPQGSTTMPQIYNTSGSNQSLNYMWQGLFNGLIDGALHKAGLSGLEITLINGFKIESVVYKFFYDFSSDVANFQGFNAFLTVLINLAKPLEVLVPKLKQIINYINEVKGFLANEPGPFYDQVYKGTLLSDIYKELGKLGLKLPDWLTKDIPNIKYFFHSAPINDVIKDIGNKTLPYWLYCISGKSIADIAALLKNQFKQPTSAAQDAEPLISPSSLSQLFDSMGVTANKAPKVTGFNPPTILIVNKKTYREDQTSTLGYAIALMAQNVPATDNNSGVSGGFSLMGYNNKNQTFENNSVFANIKQLYAGGGMTYIVGAISNIINTINKGMSDNEDKNFIPKLNNNNFYLHPESQWTIVIKGKQVSKVDFQLDFKQPDLQKLTYTIELTWVNKIIKFKWLRVTPT